MHVVSNKANEVSLVKRRLEEISEMSVYVVSNYVNVQKHKLSVVLRDPIQLCNRHIRPHIHVLI
jgi:hypothetical protein